MHIDCNGRHAAEGKPQRARGATTARRQTADNQTADLTSGACMLCRLPLTHIVAPRIALPSSRNDHHSTPMNPLFTQRRATSGAEVFPFLCALLLLLLLYAPAIVFGARGGNDQPEERRCATVGTAYSSCFAPNVCCGNSIGAGCRPPEATCCGENKSVAHSGCTCCAWSHAQLQHDYLHTENRAPVNHDQPVSRLSIDTHDTTLHVPLLSPSRCFFVRFCHPGHSCCGGGGNGGSCCKDELGECCGGKCCLTRIPQPFVCTSDLRCVKRRHSDSESSSSGGGAEMSSSSASAVLWPFSSSAAEISSTAVAALPDSSSAAADVSSSAVAELSSSAAEASSSEPAPSSSAAEFASSSADAASSSAPAASSTADAPSDLSSSSPSPLLLLSSSSTASDEEEQPPSLDDVARELPSDGRAPNITNLGDSPSGSTTKTGAVGALLALIGGMVGIALLCNMRTGTGTICCGIETGGRRSKSNARSSPAGDPSPTESNIAVCAQICALGLCVASLACDRYASLRYNIVTAFYGLDHIVFRIDGDYGPGGEQRTTASEDFQCGSEQVQTQLDASRRACDTLAALSAVVFILIVAASVLTLRCCLELAWLRARNMPLRVSSQLTTGAAAVGRPGRWFNFVSCQWAATVALGAAWSCYLWGPYLLLQESLGNTDATARLEVGWILCLAAFAVQLPQTIYWPKLEWTEMEAAEVAANNKLTGTSSDSAALGLTPGSGAVVVQMSPVSSVPSPSAVGSGAAAGPAAREAWGTTR